MKSCWQTKTLGETCAVVNGGTPKTGVSEYWDGQHRWITPAEMGKRSSPYVAITERMISELGLRNSSAQLLPPFSVILSSRAPIGHLVINTELMATNQGCKGLIPRDNLQYKYLYYYLISIVELLNSLGTGTTFKELSGGKLKEVQIPIPPLTEQKRIVAKLDEAFAGLAKAKENAEKNLQNARALFESHLDLIFSEHEQKWPKRTIGEIADVYDGPHATPKTVGEGPIFLGISSLNDGKINLGETRHVTPSDFEKWTRRVKPQADDVVFSYETRLGQAAIVPKDMECCLGRRMGLVRLKHAVCDPFFFVYQYISPPFRSFLKSKTIKGTTVDRISLREFPSFPISLPGIDEQRRLVEKILSLQVEFQKLSSVYNQKNAAVAELKKSILHEAFSGNL